MTRARLEIVSLDSSPPPLCKTAMYPKHFVGQALWRVFLYGDDWYSQWYFDHRWQWISILRGDSKLSLMEKIVAPIIEWCYKFAYG